MGQCICCSGESLEERYSFTDIFGDTHQLVQCENCHVFSLAVLPTTKQQQRAYDETYYGEGESKFHPIVEAVIDWFRIRNAKKFARRLLPNAKVLDIGCGNGSFLVNLGKQGGFKLYGLEPEGKSGDRASQYAEINLHRGFLEEDTYQENFFDAIILTHVYEHLPNPKESLDILTQIAKKGACLQIEIPNINSWQAKLYKGFWFHLDPPRHLNMFPPVILKAELQQRGWSVVDERYFSPQFSPYGAQQSILNKVIRKRDLLYEHLKGNKSYTKGASSLSLVLQKLFHWLSYPLFVGLDLIASAFKKGATVKLVFSKDE